MNHDELAVVCEQLAGMLRVGMTLPVALRQTAATLPRGRMRRELERVESRLAEGQPIASAMAESRFPVLMKQAFAFGADEVVLAETLAMAAAHFRRHHELWSRTRLLVLHGGGLLLIGIGCVTVTLTLVASIKFCLAPDYFPLFEPMNALGYSQSSASSFGWLYSLLWPLAAWLLAGIVLVGSALAIFNRAVRERLFWRLPGAKETQLCLLASAIALMLRRGRTLPEALEVVLASTSRHPAWDDLRYWQQRLADGYVGLWETTNRYKWFPPLFVWLIDRDGQDLEFGFRRTAEIYEARAIYKTTLWQQCLLPIGFWFIAASVLAAGIFFSYAMLRPLI